MDLDKLVEQLFTEEKFQNMKTFCDRVLQHNMQQEAYAYVKNMRAILKNITLQDTYPEKFETYYDFYIKFQFINLNRFRPEDLAPFFEKHWVEQYDIPYFSLDMLTDLVYVSLMKVLIYQERDQYKQDIVEALRKNKQILFSIIADTGSNNKKKSLTISCILTDFRTETYQKSNKQVGIREYMVQVQKKFKLGTEQVEKLSVLLNFYTQMQLSSMEVEGIEEPFIFQEEGDAHIRVLNKGTVESIHQPKVQQIVTDVLQLRKKLKEKRSQDISDERFKKLLNNYKLVNLNWETITKQAEGIEKQYAQPDKFFTKFHEAINKRDKLKIVAYLLVLAHLGQLDEIFERDKKIKDIFYKHLVNKFTNELGEHFNKNLRKPVYLSYFLQHLLKDILKLSENESAVLAIKLTNELKRAGDKEYLPIAYGDITSGIFKWKTIIEKDNQLDLLDN